MSKQQPEWVDLPGALVRADRVVAVEAVGASSVVVHFSTGQRLPVEARDTYLEYRQKSLDGEGRCAHERVYLLRHGEIYHEHINTVDWEADDD